MLSKEDLEAIREMLQPMQNEIKKINLTMENVIQPQIETLNGRIDRMEKHANSEFAKINLTLENVIQPQIEALAEGHQLILDKLPEKSRVETLEDKVEFLESVVRRISKDLEDMRKAN